MGMYSSILVSPVSYVAANLMAAVTREPPNTHFRALRRLGKAGLGAEAGRCLCSAFALQMSRPHHARCPSKYVF